MHNERPLYWRKASDFRRAAVMRLASLASDTQSAFLVARASVPLPSPSLGGRRRTQIFRARAVPRWLWSVYNSQKGAAPARGASPSVQDRGATCQLRPLARSGLLCGTRGRATALAVSREEAQHSSLPRARAVPHWLWSIRIL